MHLLIAPLGTRGREDEDSPEAAKAMHVCIVWKEGEGRAWLGKAITLTMKIYLTHELLGRIALLSLPLSLSLFLSLPWRLAALTF